MVKLTEKKRKWIIVQFRTGRSATSIARGNQKDYINYIHQHLEINIISKNELIIIY